MQLPTPVSLRKESATRSQWILVRSPGACHIIPLTLILMLLTAYPAPAPAQLNIQKPQQLRRVASPLPLEWESVNSRVVVCRPGLLWTVTQEKTISGWAEGEGVSREIQQTRIRFDLGEDGEGGTVGYLQHTGNTGVRILTPGDPRLTKAGPAVSDSLRPWPNACGISFQELSQALDLNANNTNEIPFRRFGTIPGPAASGIVLVEADSEGVPRIVELTEFVGTVRFDEGNLTGINWPPGARHPRLKAEFLPLSDCRFIAQLGIRGEPPCGDCCRIPIVLQADENGVYHPVYDKDTQNYLLSRLTEDLGKVVNAPVDSSLTPEAQIALARAGAFFYLTGTGRNSRSYLERALEDRPLELEVSLLLHRMDEYFLLPSD